MSDHSDAEREPIELLAEEFVDRIRRGEQPTVEEYASRSPDLAEEILDLFPAIAAIEESKVPSEGYIKLAPPPECLDDFQLLREIGRGGMGIVYEAYQKSLGRRVALKLLPKLALYNTSHLQRFRREARTAAKLHHTNIVPVFGVGHQDEYHYFVMQFIEGAGLDRVLKRLEQSMSVNDKINVSEIVQSIAASQETIADRAMLTTFLDIEPEDDLREARDSEEQSSASLSGSVQLTPGASPRNYWESVAVLGVQVAEALAYAHQQGVLHRDIKPANLLVDTQGKVWVADFGLSKALENEQLSASDEMMGTPAYMAPEQLRGETDHRSDIYSLGLTLYELATLQSPFPAANRAELLHRIATEQPARPRQVRPSIPTDLETIILTAIAPEPASRYQSADDLAGDLQRYLENRPIVARRTSALKRLWLWHRRNPTVAALSGAAIALLVLVAVTAMIGYAHTASALAGERKQRERAETANELAVEALDRIYSQLSPDPAMAARLPQDRTPVSPATAAMLEEMLTFYDRLAEQEDGQVTYGEQIALANRHIGDIRHHLGQLEQAKSAYLKALEQYRVLDEVADARVHLFDQAIVLVEYGIVIDRLREPAEARESWKEAKKLLSQLQETSNLSSEMHVLEVRVKDLLEGRKDSRPPMHRGDGMDRPRQPRRPVGPRRG
ncbi:serine/threonine protein kinase [Aeoliella mucimassa]|uniref:Serine/threonine-protein kinase PrkC n=1 Tax=Aeoliella mucimassa TaxID=2527972 RepID=A0A518AMJ5_9BACT|nr:serine/threonine-protein kinase [Aeoliella mucimassa]QDU55926.1 Serine/threonine-protein kinase PrkC [Aeoliella mucimassa]